MTGASGRRTGRSDGASTTSAERDSRQGHRQPADSIPVAEWIAASIGLVLMLGALWVLLSHGLSGNDGPPDVTLRVVAVQRTTGGWLVRFEARNGGDETASELGVRGELVAGDSAVETAETTLDYLPGGSTRTGGLFFARDPASARLRLTATGYRDP